MITLALLIKLPQHSLLPTKTGNYISPAANMTIPGHLCYLRLQVNLLGWGGVGLTGKYLPTGIELGKNLNF